MKQCVLCRLLHNCFRWPKECLATCGMTSSNDATRFFEATFEAVMDRVFGGRWSSERRAPSDNNKRKRPRDDSERAADLMRGQKLISFVSAEELDRLRGGKLRRVAVELGVEGADTCCEAVRLREGARAKAKANASCPVCMEDHVSGSKVTLLSCTHVMHPECAVKWAQASLELQKTDPSNQWPRPRCPVCRAEVGAEKAC